MRVLMVSIALCATLLASPVARAQTGPEGSPSADEGAAEDPAEERATQFVGVTGAEAERIPGGALLLAAYAVAWALLFGFLLRMRGLQRRTADELDRLSAEIRASGGD